jgi:hypothetical protein
MYSGDEYYGDEITSPIAQPVYYEVRERSANMMPQDRGTLVGLYATFAEAMDAATKLDAAGRKVDVCRSLGWTC